MRIALVSDFSLSQINGISDVLGTLIPTLRARGHAVCMCEPSFRRKRSPDIVTDDQCRLPSIGLPGASEIRLVVPWGFDAALRRFCPDVLHVHTFGCLGMAALSFGGKNHLPVVGTDHTLPAEYLRHIHLNFPFMRHRIKSFAARFYGRCDLVTAPSQFLAKELQEYGMSRPCKIVSNPIDTDTFKPLEKRMDIKKKFGIRHTAFLSFGRLAAEKNIEETLRAFAFLHRRRSDSTLVVIGDGPSRARLEATARRLGIGDATMFLGMLRGNELVQAINATDAYVITSPSENQSMTTLQAKACGLPVIVTDQGGNPEAVIDGETGFIVRSGDIETMSERMETLLKEPELRERFGQRNRHDALERTPDVIAEHMEGVYQAAIA